MAEALAIAAGRFIVADLLQLNEKLKAMTGIKKKMRKLKELSTIIDKVIQDVELHPFIEDAAKDLLKNLKYLAYDLEDVVDYYNTKVLQKKQRSDQTSLRRVRDSFSSNNQVTFKGRMMGVMIKASFKRVRDSFSYKPVVFKIKMGRLIKAITESLEFILSQKSILDRLSQDSISMSELSLRVSKISLNGETHSIHSWEVKGRDTEKQMIIEMLTEDNDDESNHDTVKVIAIVGMGGLGKTTLAQLVYNDQRVKSHFESLMWKVVGAEFDLTKIMKSILQLATHKPVKISEIDLVMQDLKTALSGKKFLLVLDDVWNEDPFEWGKLKAALTCGARGSKILVTTRNQQVSSIMGSSNTTHQIQQLFRDDCLSLFQQFAFGNETVDQKLMEIGEKIVEKCGGVPLAVISLGGMLRGRDEAHWSRVLKREIWQLKNNEEEKLFAILKLSYNALSLQSKNCFAFCSLFPKDYMMRKDELIKLWIANGFISSERNVEAETVGQNVEAETVGQNVEAEGNDIFDDLVWRSFILLRPVQYDPDVTKCMMHDLMHDLARSVSADAYWNSDQDWNSNQESVKFIGKRTYHLQIVEGKLPDMTKVLGKKPSNLRTFMFKDKSSRFSINLLKVFSKLKFLRVLDLSESGIREIPTSIGNLIHLRYLSLYYNIIEVLPMSIGNLIQLRYLDLYMNRIEVLPTSIGNLIHLRNLNLYGNHIEVLPDSITLLSNLQYLNLSFNHKLRELPKELGNMQNLRDLDLPMDNRLTHMPGGLSGLTNLRSLPLFIASDKTGACSIIELEGLKLHGEMKIKFSKDFKNYSCDGRKILKNQKLNELCIEFNGSEGYDKGMLDDLCPNTTLKKLSIRDYGSPQFPTWLIELQLPNLVEVCLMNCRVCEHILPFQNLQFLKKLNLQSMAEITQMVAEFHGRGGFPSLQELYLDKMDNLEEWSKSHDVDELFPKLQRLKISRCPKLKSMPRLPTIEHLEISCCSGSLVSCIERLTSLSVLSVDNMDDITSLPSGCIRNLTSLTDLAITNCREFQSLPGDELQHLEMIHSLVIYGCRNFASFPLEVRHLSSLCFLGLTGCPSIILQPEKLVEILNSVPEFLIQICGKKVNLRGQLQYLHRLEELILLGAHDETSIYEWHGFSELIICCCDELESLMTTEQTSTTVLEQLYIDGFSNLTTLPDWLQHLKSLRLLSVENCPRLETVPRGLKNLHMLEDLMIAGCPQLESRCEREIGEDWPIISHVQNVDIRSSDSAGEEAEDEDSVDEDGADEDSVDEDGTDEDSA